MIALLLVTQNEGELLRANIRHHLEWGVDHVGVADNDSTDATAEIAREFGDAVSYRRFPDFHERQRVRTTMLDELRTRHTVTWVGVADTDEFYWAEGVDGLGALLADTPDDVVGVNFDMKLYLPTGADVPDEPVFMSRAHRTGSSASPLHTSYRAGKSFYRADWLTTITDEHWCREVPHPQFRHDEPAVHHYMVQDEDQFVQKVARLIAWAPPPDGRVARLRWRRTPEVERPLPGWSAPFKKDWWRVYQRGGEGAVREYYRNVYTLSGDRLREALANGSLVEDAGFAALVSCPVRSGPVIVSFEHGFAFIKVQKTAGTSIEVFLSQVAGPDAIVTPISPPEPGHEPRNFHSSGRRRWRSGRTPRSGRDVEPEFYNHMPASLVRDRIGAGRWDALFRFSFERNPWDKAVSFYFWRTRRLDAPPPFEEWATTPGNLVSEREMYTVDGDLAVDFVGRYESLTADLQSVLDRVGIRTSIELPRAKGEFRPADEQTPIGRAADVAIRETYAWEIDHFGYARPAEIPWEPLG